MLTQRNINTGGSIPAKELFIGHLAGDFDVPAEPRSVHQQVQVRFITACLIEFTDQDKFQRNVPDRPDLINELDQLVLAFVRHDPSDKQKPEHGAVVMERRLRVRSASDGGEILEQWDDGYVVKAALAQLQPIE